MDAVLSANGLRKRFGGLWAVDDVSLDVERGQIIGLIGPNGSGKTTLINLLNGVHRPDAGTVSVRDTDVTGQKPHVRAAHGITRTFQTARVFSTISVVENMLVPTLHRKDSSSELQDRADELLEFVALSDKRDIAASELSGGQQKLLEYARALMTEPDVVLMDEPFAGVHPSIKELLLERIAGRNKDGTSFVIVSHEVPDLLALSHHVVCLDHGKLIASGLPDDVRDDEQVVTAYLGKPVAPGGAL